MEKAIYELCCDVCSIAYHLDQVNYREKVLNLIKTISQNEAYSFTILHRFWGEGDNEDTIHLKNLNLLQAAEMVYELNKNISSYEYYFLTGNKEETP